MLKILVFTPPCSRQRDRGPRSLGETAVIDLHPMALQLLASAGVADTTTTFFLKQRGASELHAAVQRISDPASPSWGQFFTHAEVVALQAPRDEHLQAVTEHLRKLAPGETAATRWS